MSATLFLTKDRLTTALTRDRNLQNLQIGLQMEFLRRGWAELPPPPPLQRARRYYPNLQTDVQTLQSLIYKYPRVYTLLTSWVKISKSSHQHTLIAEMKELRDFLIVAPSIVSYFLRFNEEGGGYEVATIYLLRHLNASATHIRIHSAIRSAIISPEHNFLLEYGKNMALSAVSAIELDGALPYYIQNPTKIVAREYDRDLQLGVATGLLHEIAESLVPEYTQLCRIVRIAQVMLRRAPIILYQFRAWGWEFAPTLDAWYGFCTHTRNLEEMHEILEVAGLEIGPER